MRASVLTLPVAGILGAAVVCTALGACGSRSAIFASPGDAAVAMPDAGMDTGARMGMPCNTDADCVTDRFCVASSRCDSLLGCVFSALTCDDGVDCTVDSCSEETRSCSHAPEDSLCPAADLCSPTRGCDSFVYAVTSDSHLDEVRVPSGALVDLGQVSSMPGDIALGTDGTLYATDSYNLYRVDRTTLAATKIAAILPQHQYKGLGIGATGALVALADANDVFLVSATTGSATVLAPLPVGYRASGDVASYGGRVFVTMVPLATPGNDALLALDGATQQWSVVAPDLGQIDAWGLAFLGATAYVLTASGAVIAADPIAGGSVVQVAQVRGATFVGAAGR